MNGQLSVVFLVSTGIETGIRGLHSSGMLRSVDS